MLKRVLPLVAAGLASALMMAPAHAKITNCIIFIDGLRAKAATTSNPGFQLRNSSRLLYYSVSSANGASVSFAKTGGSSTDPLDQQALTDFTTSPFWFKFPTNTTVQGAWKMNGVSAGAVTLTYNTLLETRYTITMNSTMAAKYKMTSFHARCAA